MANTSKEKLITLKEASTISGYAPDYIGQLIRKGKIPGKQVYHAVAWMTTENAVREYIEKNLDGRDDSLKGRIRYAAKDTRLLILGWVDSTKPLKLILYVTIGLTIVFTLILFYILSVVIDKALNENALQRVESRM